MPEARFGSKTRPVLKVLCAVALFFMSVSAAHAATAVQKLTYDTYAVTFAGQSLVIDFSCPTLPPGEILFFYSRDFFASVSIADAFSANPTARQVVFSGFIFAARAL